MKIIYHYAGSHMTHRLKAQGLTLSMCRGGQVGIAGHQATGLQRNKGCIALIKKVTINHILLIFSSQYITVRIRSSSYR